MEKIVEQGLLFDFYGDMLTEHQKQVFGDVILGDLSLSEAAEAYGVSRQGIHDLVRRVDSQLRSYEDKLHMVERSVKVKKQTEDIRRTASGQQISLQDQQKIISICDSILSEL